MDVPQVHRFKALVSWLATDAKRMDMVQSLPNSYGYPKPYSSSGLHPDIKM